jgi:hypothetical protein
MKFQGTGLLILPDLTEMLQIIAMYESTDQLLNSGQFFLDFHVQTFFIKILFLKMHLDISNIVRSFYTSFKSVFYFL